MDKIARDSIANLQGQVDRMKGRVDDLDAQLARLTATVMRRSAPVTEDDIEWAKTQLAALGEP